MREKLDHIPEEIYEEGYGLFDTKEKFENWLITDSAPLGASPSSIILKDTKKGVEKVLNEIYRIKYNTHS